MKVLYFTNIFRKLEAGREDLQKYNADLNKMKLFWLAINVEEFRQKTDKLHYCQLIRESLLKKEFHKEPRPTVVGPKTTIHKQRK